MTDLDRLMAYLDERFAEIRERFAQTDRRLDGIDERFAQIDQRLDNVDERFAQIDQRLDAIDARFAQIDQRLDAVDEHFTQMNEQMDKRFAEIVAAMTKLHQAMIDQVVHNFEKKFGELQVGLADIKLRMKELEMRVEMSLDTVRLELMKHKEDIGWLKHKVLDG